jgi:hypothetical protein
VEGGEGENGGKVAQNRHSFCFEVLEVAVFSAKGFYQSILITNVRFGNVLIIPDLAAAIYCGAAYGALLSDVFSWRRGAGRGGASRPFSQARCLWKSAYNNQRYYPQNGDNRR